MQTRKKILAVDDNPTNLAIFEELLGKQYNLKTVSTGQDALKSAQDFQPDLILLDIMMPDIDGYEVCRRIRMNPVLRYTKIIIVSAKAMASERLKGYQVGADDYFTKPFHEEELLAKVRVYLRLKSAQETEQNEHDLLDNIYCKITASLNALTRSAQTLMSDESVDTNERKILAEKVYLCAKEVQSFFEKMVRPSVGKSEESSLELEPANMHNAVHDAIHS